MDEIVRAPRVILRALELMADRIREQDSQISKLKVDYKDLLQAFLSPSPPPTSEKEDEQERIDAEVDELFANADRRGGRRPL